MGLSAGPRERARSEAGWGGEDCGGSAWADMEVRAGNEALGEGRERSDLEGEGRGDELLRAKGKGRGPRGAWG